MNYAMLLSTVPHTAHLAVLPDNLDCLTLAVPTGNRGVFACLGQLVRLAKFHFPR